MADGIRIKIGLDGVQQVQAGAAAAAQSLGQVGASAGRTGQQTAQLSAQIQDFFVQVQAGGNPLTALIQQGSQLSAVYGGVGNAFRAVTGLLTPAVVAIGGLAAGVGALALAYKQGSAEADAYNRALILTGNIAGTTSGQLKEMAKAQAAVAGTQGQAAAVLAQLAASGQVAARDLSKAAAAAIKFELAGGSAADETAKKLIDLGKAPLQTLIRLNEAENFLTVSVYKRVRALEIAGKTADAAAVAQNAYAEALVGRAGQLEQTLGFFQRLWRDVKKEAAEAWDIMLGIGREDSLEERLKRAQERVRNARPSIYSPGAIQYGVKGEAEGDVRALSRSLLNQTESAAAARAAALETQKVVEQTDKLLAQQAARAQAAYAVMAARIKGDIEQIQSALKQGLSSPIEAIEREGAKRVDLLKAELQLLKAQQDVAKETVGGRAQVAQLQGQIDAKNIEIGNEQVATQNRVKEAIYATKRAAEELYRVEAEEAARAIADDKLKNRDIFNAQFDQAREYARSVDDANEAIALQTQLIGANDQARAVAIERLRIEQEERKKLRAIDEQDGLLPDQRAALKERVSEAAARARGAAEGKAYLEEFQRIYDDLSQGLTNAIIEGGKSARDYLRSLFRSLVLQPLLRPLVAPISGLIASAGAGTSFADTGAAGGSTLGQVGQAASLYDAGQKIYAGFESGFAGIGTAAKGAYFSFFESGAVGSANAAQIAAASGEAGYYGSASGAYSTAAGTSANASLVANVASTAAGVAVGVMAGRALSGGYSAIGGNSGNTAVNVGTAIGAIWGPIGAALGGAIGGVVNRAFGRKAPEVEGRSIEGTITGGDFAGSAITSILEKGGLFRSDKRSTQSQTITGDLDKALDEGATQLSALAKKYGDALGLPVDQLANVSASIKVKVTDDAAENTKAIADALGQYADALLGTFADQIEPFRKSGETVAQTIERVGGALLGVNDVLTTLGLTALSASLDGGKAALALTDLFGGASNFAQSAGSYYQKFYSEAERADRATAQITKTLAEFGIQAPATRDAYRALVEAQDLTTAGGQKTFAALLSLADAFDAVQTASDGAAEAAKRQADDETAANNKRLQDAISSNIGKFLPFDQQQAFGYQRVSSDLAAVGVNADASVLQNATKDQILEVARAFLAVASNSVDAKLAIVEAAGALADLKDAAAAAAEQAAKDAAARIASLQSNVDSVAADFLSPQELVNYRATRIQEILAGANIETTVAGIIGSTTDTVRQLFESVGIDGKEAILQALPLWKALNDSLTATSRAVAAYRSGTLADAIEQARLSSLSPADRVARLRGTEASLFEQLSTSDDPVAVAQRLAGVITALASEESKLTEAVRTQRLNSLRDELDAAKSIKDVITGLPQFTSSLKFGDLSPLSAKQQLSEAQKLFDSTLVRAIGGDKTAAANLQTNAQALISEAISAFGSGAQASAVFERTTAALEAFTAQVGPTLDPKISTLEAQLAAQEDTAESSAAMLAALLRIDSTLAGRAGTATTTATGGTSDRTGEPSITDLVTSPGPVETATLIAAQTAELSAQTARLGTIVANTAQTVTTLQTSVADQREGYLQLIARQRATEDALQQILSELRGGRVPA